MVKLYFIFQRLETVLFSFTLPGSAQDCCLHQSPGNYILCGFVFKRSAVVFCAMDVTKVSAAILTVTMVILLCGFAVEEN